MKLGTRRLVVVAMRASAYARSIVKQHLEGGDNVVVVQSDAQARGLSCPFAHGIFGFELEGGGSGIVLAARLLARGQLGSFEIVHPEDERRASGRPSQMVA